MSHSRISGEAGVKDGRLDMILQRGEYKIITYSHLKSKGEVTVKVVPFKEKNSTPLSLVKHKPIEESLKDFEQTSYWLNGYSKKDIILEAAGRNLKDLRIWKDGNWLTDVSPRI